MNWNVLEKNNFDRALIAKEMNLDINSIKLQNKIDECILEEIKKITNYKKIDECLRGLDFTKVNKARHLTNKRIESLFEFYYKIIKVRKKEELIELCKNSFYPFNIANLHDFTVKYTECFNKKDMFDEIYDNLMKKLEFYKEYRKPLSIEEANEARRITKEEGDLSYLNTAREVVLDFIESEYSSIKEFLYYYNKNRLRRNIHVYEITEQNFKKYLSVLKKYDNTIYMMYETKVNQISERNYVILCKIASKIVEKIKNGVIENGETREFDLLDYYFETKLSPETILKILQYNHSPDEKIFRQFANKYKYKRRIDHMVGLMDENHTLEIEFDSEGNLISESGIKITNEEKKKVIEYLKENHIPLYDRVYYIALKRYVNNLLNNKQGKKI